MGDLKMCGWCAKWARLEEMKPNRRSYGFYVCPNCNELLDSLPYLPGEGDLSPEEMECQRKALESYPARLPG